MENPQRNPPSLPSFIEALVKYLINLCSKNIKGTSVEADIAGYKRGPVRSADRHKGESIIQYLRDISSVRY